jgi:integrase
MAIIDKSNDSEIRMRCLEEIGGADGELIFFEGLDAAIIGVGTMAGNSPRVVYDRARCIEILDALTGENASAYFEHNIECGYVGTATPLFLTWIRNEAA